MNDRYRDFADLNQAEHEGVDFEISTERLPSSRAVIVAPHGGGIEPLTAPIAQQIAADNFSLYCFKGKKPGGGNRVLHITSHHFDEPRCLKLIADHQWVVSIHGSEEPGEMVFIGGLDKNLIGDFVSALLAAGIPAKTNGHRYPAEEPTNICNRGASGRGVQFELTLAVRKGPKRNVFIDTVRAVLQARSLTPPDVEQK